jgi:hypothetical protein
LAPFSLAAPFLAEARTTLLRFLREKGVGTVGQRYKLTRVKQSFCKGWSVRFLSGQKSALFA